jgi:uncharacterized protein YhaN
VRFGELVLERYGDYEELRVPLSAGGLNVIYGPNEAGKSSCLNAITDFFFGIPQNSSYGNRYGYRAMRIRATLLLPDGRRLNLCRRKGYQNTLSDENGRNVDESILRRLLHDVERERFSTLFGLGHEDLRTGGRNLLKAEGDVGRLILEAGGGLRRVIERIEKLEKEADGLFASRRSTERRFYKLYDEFRAASEEAKQGMLTFETYQQAQQVLKQAESRYQQNTQDRAALEKRKSERERANRVMPLLRQLDQIEQEIETYADVSQLRPAFATEVQETLAARRQAEEVLEEVANHCRVLERKIRDLPIDQSLLNVEAEVRTISEKATHVKSEWESRPNRERELAEQQAKLLPLRGLLNIEPDADLKKHVPPADARENARQLANRGRSLGEQISSLEQRIKEGRLELGSLSEEQQRLRDKGFDRAIPVQLSSANALLRLCREAESSHDRAAEIEVEISRYLNTWGFPEIEALRNFSCPDPDVVEAEIRRREELERKLGTDVENLRQAKEKLLLAEKTIERLQAAGQVPTDAAIDHVRLERKSAWDPIRSAYLSDAPETLCSIAMPERKSNVNRFEDRTEEADRLADRKSAEAQRLTDLAAAEKDRDDAVITIGSLERACEEWGEMLASEVMRFEQTWPQAVQKESVLTKLKQLIRNRATTLQQAAEASRLRQEGGERQAEADRGTATLAQAEADLRITSAPESGIHARIRVLELANQAYREGHSQWLQNSAKHEQLERQLVKARTDLADIKEKFTQWQEGWQDSMQRLRLPPASPIEFVEELLREWPQAQTSVALIENIEHRLDQFKHDHDDLAKGIAAISPPLSFRLPDDPVAAAEMLRQRLDEARELEAQRRTLLTQKAEADEDHGRKQQRVDELNRTVLQLCEEANVDRTTLMVAASRLQSLIQIRQSYARKLEEMRAAGDGKSIEELRAECEGLDADGLRAELEEIRNERERLDQEIQQAYAGIKARERELQEFTAAAGINAAEARRQSAAAEMRAVTERYLEIKLAQTLLNQAIDRLREERQNPLLARAGELFKQATRGSYIGIVTDIDERGVPVVVGKRPAGGEIPVEVMSDGTRDQLFLSFRIASVEQYCSQSGPIPFIADDLLVHFDDVRSAAAVELLADLGCHTQVLLFTHHRAVRDMAEAVLKTDTFAITDLPA